MTEAPQLQAYCQRLRAFIQDPSKGVFDLLALELFKQHMEINPIYRRYSLNRGWPLDRVTHWRQIPALPTAAFKELEATWLTPEQRLRVFHSSGTSLAQQPSRHFHNDLTLGIYEASLWASFQECVARQSAGPFSYLALTPPPHQAPHSSLVHMFATVQKHSSGSSFEYCGRAVSATDWHVDLALARAALERACARRFPAVLLGPAFAFAQLLDGLKDTRVSLPMDSRAMETGGYKGRAQAWPKDILRSAIGAQLGIAPAFIVGEYGMSELSSQAYDARAGQPGGMFHFPSWARSIIVSPETGEEVAEGQTGLIRVVDLANVSSAPVVQTEDLGIRRGSGFEWAGRATGAERRGCSLLMSDVS